MRINFPNVSYLSRYQWHACVVQPSGTLVYTGKGETFPERRADADAVAAMYKTGTVSVVEYFPLTGETR